MTLGDSGGGSLGRTHRLRTRSPVGSLIDLLGQERAAERVRLALTRSGG